MQFNLPSAANTGAGTFTASGGVLTTELYLATDPASSLQACTKRYVDSKISTIASNTITSGIMPIARFPGYSGDIVNTAGSNVLNLKNSGVTPGTYPKVTVTGKGLTTQGMVLSTDDIPNLSWGKFSLDRPTTLSGLGVTNALPKSGGVLTGFISVMNAPTQTLHAANKRYVDEQYLIADGLPSTGVILRSPSTATPPGFLRCNGGIVSKALYSDLYTVVGDEDSELIKGSGQPWRQQYLFNNTNTVNLTGWTLTGSLPLPVANGQVVVTKNRVYLIGGRTTASVPLSDVYTTTISGDGSLGSWTQSTSLPEPFFASQAVVTKNKVYLLGGISGVSSNVNTVYVADINTDGTLGVWTTTTPLPGPLARSQAIITKSRIYLLGGWDSQSTYTSVVYTAPIDSNGIIGAWSTSKPLPSELARSQSVVTRNRVYLIGGGVTSLIGGGVTSSSYSTVYTAAINGDGTLGDWSTSTPLPVNLSSTQAVVTRSRLYLISGIVDNEESSLVYTAIVNEDGTIGTWTQAASLPIETANAHVIVTNGKIHLIGGYKDTTHFSSVYTANFSGGSNDYSFTYTSGYVTVDPVNFRLPDYTSLENADFRYYIKY